MNHSRLVLTFTVLCHLWPPGTRGYSRGAPRSTCGGGTNASMTPRHGFSPQTRPSPAYIVVDQSRVLHTDYVRVTNRGLQGIQLYPQFLAQCSFYFTPSGAAIYHCIHVIIKENVQQLNVKGMRHAVLLMVRHEGVYCLPILELQLNKT